MISFTRGFESAEQQPKKKTEAHTNQLEMRTFSAATNIRIHIAISCLKLVHH